MNTSPIYVLCPGYVRSRTDGDRHFISGDELARLYGLKGGPNRCNWIIEPTGSMALGWSLPPGAILLRPRSDGNYTLPQPQPAPVDYEVHRGAFEQQCWAYYGRLKAAGWSDAQEGDTTLREALFWRQEDGRYGVHSVQQAWEGFKFGVEAFVPRLNAFGGALQEIASQVHVPVGGDTTLETLPAVKRLQALAINAVRHLQKLLDGPSYAYPTQQVTGIHVDTPDLHSARRFLADVTANIDAKGHL